MLRSVILELILFLDYEKAISWGFTGLDWVGLGWTGLDAKFLGSGCPLRWFAWIGRIFTFDFVGLPWILLGFQRARLSRCARLAWITLGIHWV